MRIMIYMASDYLRRSAAYQRVTGAELLHLRGLLQTMSSHPVTLKNQLADSF